MKVILFCQNAYAFGILAPIKTVLENEGHTFIWYIQPKLLQNFPFKNEPFTTHVQELQHYNSDVIFVPGNEVPYYLRGLKTQVFHGFAGEKKGHFRIRHYFDLYLTQGPFFTKKFNELKSKFNNFDVLETGWPKLDVYAQNKSTFAEKRTTLSAKNNTTHIILYAPTFSPSLSSAPYLLEEIKALAAQNNYCILIKFHPLMAQKWIETYKKLAATTANIEYIDEPNIVPYLQMADVLISDTSSVIYEFLLLNKPVITFKNISTNIKWRNSLTYSNLVSLVSNALHNDEFAESRTDIMQAYHPYNDGKSAERMVHAVQNYIVENGVPNQRKLSFLRRRKIHKLFGKPAKPQ